MGNRKPAEAALSVEAKDCSYERSKEWLAGQITVFSGPEHRPRWSDEQRLQILSKIFAPDAFVSEVARRHEVSTCCPAGVAF